jgi:hypothetical protein
MLDQGKPKSSGARSVRKKSWWSRQTGPVQATVAAAVIAAVASITAAAIPLLRSGDGSKADKPSKGIESGALVRSPSAGPALKSIDLVIRDPMWKGETLVPPAAEITVHNVGGRRSVATRLDVTVEDSAVINACHTEGGAVELSATYDLTLPLQPAAGTEFRVPISQQQAADEADRFALRLGVAQKDESKKMYVYRLTFALEADGNPERLPVGSAVVSLPWTPDNRDAAYYWSKQFEDGTNSLDWLGAAEAARTTQCMKSQSLVLGKLLAAGGELSPELAAVKSELRP